MVTITDFTVTNAKTRGIYLNAVDKDEDAPAQIRLENMQVTDHKSSKDGFFTVPHNSKLEIVSSSFNRLGSQTEGTFIEADKETTTIVTSSTISNSISTNGLIKLQDTS